MKKACKVVDYRPYMKPYYIFYILSIILSIAYIFLLVYGFITAVEYFRNLDLSARKVIYTLLVLPIFGIVVLFLAVEIIYGLIASILAMIVPNKATISLNAVLGFLSFTFLNAAASLSILRNAENENKNIGNY